MLLVLRVYLSFLISLFINFQKFPDLIKELYYLKKNFITKIEKINGYLTGIWVSTVALFDY